MAEQEQRGDVGAQVPVDTRKDVLSTAPQSEPELEVEVLEIVPQPCERPLIEEGSAGEGKGSTVPPSENQEEDQPQDPPGGSEEEEGQPQDPPEDGDDEEESDDYSEADKLGKGEMHLCN